MAFIELFLGHEVLFLDLETQNIERNAGTVDLSLGPSTLASLMRIQKGLQPKNLDLAPVKHVKNKTPQFGSRYLRTSDGRTEVKVLRSWEVKEQKRTVGSFGDHCECSTAT